MRAPAAIAGFAVVLLSSACTATFADPKLYLSPYYAVYRLRGDATVQTDPGGGAPRQNNPRQPLSTFGVGSHENDVGLRAEVGDGFGGIRADYYRMTMNTMRRGVLAEDFGQMQQGDFALMSSVMDELRLSWIEPVWSATTQWREEDMTFHVGAGAQATYRDLTLHARTPDDARRQSVPISGETAAAAARFRVEWQRIAVDCDYAISPHLSLGGDFGGLQQDFELRGSYHVPLRDMTFFAAYRWSDFGGDGSADGLGYAADFKLDGFQLGLTVTL